MVANTVAGQNQYIEWKQTLPFYAKGRSSLRASPNSYIQTISTLTSPMNAAVFPVSLRYLQKSIHIRYLLYYERNISLPTSGTN